MSANSSHITHGLAKWLSRRLQYLVEGIRATVKLSEDFLRSLKVTAIEDDEEMVSFDVTSLFTSIPQGLAVSVIRELLQGEEPQNPDSLNSEDLLQLLNFCLRTYFTFDGDTHT